MPLPPCPFCGAAHRPIYLTAYSRNTLRAERDSGLVATTQPEGIHWIRLTFVAFCIPYAEDPGFREDETTDPYRSLLGQWSIA